MPGKSRQAPLVSGAATGDDYVETLVAIRQQMLRFAELQLRDRSTAEDVVQEALEAALRERSQFAGRSSLKTWVFVILRNRIIDQLRRRDRTVPLSSLIDDDEDGELPLDALFDSQRAWQVEKRPSLWHDPEESMERQEFWLVFEICLDHLPRHGATAFMMREFLGFDSKEICTHLGITVGNLNVILHRARLRLRACLESHWFLPGEAPC